MSVREKYTNSASTTLASSITSGGTSLTLVDASTFPTDNFRVLVESEIMFCTSRASNVLTVVRGYEGTTAASHASAVAANHIVTAGMLDAYRRDIFGAIGLIDTSDSLSADDDNFDDENFSGWTVVQGTPNVVVIEKNHRASIVIPGGGGAGQQYGFVKNKVPSSGDYVQCGLNVGGAPGQYPIPGLIMGDGATYGSGNQIGFGYSNNENQFFLRGFTGYSAYSGQQYGGGAQFPYFMGPIHLRMTWISATHYTCEVSPDAISWAKVWNNQSILGITGTPTYMGFVATSWGSSLDLVSSFTYCRFSF